MSIENLIPIVTSIGGGFFIGIILGYFIKKIIKLLMFVTGGIIGLLIFLQHQQLITVNMEKLGGSSTYILSSVASSFDKMIQIGGTSSLGIPQTASITAGFMIGFIKS